MKKKKKWSYRVIVNAPEKELPPLNVKLKIKYMGFKEQFMSVVNEYNEREITFIDECTNGLLGLVEAKEPYIEYYRKEDFKVGLFGYSIV